VRAKAHLALAELDMDVERWGAFLLHFLAPRTTLTTSPS